jgi:tetratricopeptide (TPR) repeat protein
VGVLVIAGCHAAPEGPSRSASSDPNAAAAATARGDWSDAADRWYAVYLADHGASARPMVETARALLMNKDAESANNMVNLGLRDHPEDPDLLEMKADILEAMHFRRPAEGYYERVLAIDPQRATALLGLSRVRLELNQPGSAVKPLQELVRVRAGDYESYSMLARALTGSGDASNAFTAWDKAFGYSTSIVEDLLTASTLACDPDVRRDHPDALNTARSWLEKAVALDPQSTKAHFQLGVLSEESGKYDAAVEHYRRAIETDPACLVSLTNLAVLYAGHNDEPGTREMVKRALALEQDADRRKALLKLLEPFDKKAEEKP